MCTLARVICLICGNTKSATSITQRFLWHLHQFTQHILFNISEVLTSKYFNEGTLPSKRLKVQIKNFVVYAYFFAVVMMYKLSKAHRNLIKLILKFRFACITLCGSARLFSVKFEKLHWFSFFVFAVCRKFEFAHVWQHGNGLI